MCAVNRLFLLLIAVIAFLPLYFTPNPGYDPLLKEHNIWMLIAAALLIAIAAFKVVTSRELVLPKHYIWFLLLPIGLTAGTLINGIPYLNDLVFRAGYVVLGVLFLFALYQYRLTRRDTETALYVIVAATLLFSVVSIIQAFPGQWFATRIPQVATPLIIGPFQQLNVNASATLTGVLISIYLMTTPGFRERSLFIKAVCLLAVLLGVMVVVSTTSRVGHLAFVLALPILLLSRVKLLYRRKLVALGILLTVSVGVGTGMKDLRVVAKDVMQWVHSESGGKAENTLLSQSLAPHGDAILVAAGSGGRSTFDVTLWKFKRLLEGDKDVRQHVYKVAFDVFMDKPAYGYGIGTFQRVFHERAAEYMAARDSRPLIGPERYGHPHNELLLWGVEGGSMALLAIFAVALTVLVALYRLGWQRGAAMLAIMLPIVLHTQVELPFYTSIYHWLLLIFLIFCALSMSAQIESRVVKALPVISVSAIAGGAAALSVVYFSIVTLPVSRDLNRFFINQHLDPERFQAASENPYFGEFATMLRLKVQLNHDLLNRTNHWTREFISWSERYVQKTPEVTTIHAIALAYRNLGMNRRALETLNRGLYLYPGNKSLSDLYRQTLTGR